ncbi:MAG: GNAT family N-acetyltransferase [Verrucomicrobiota bacterium]
MEWKPQDLKTLWIDHDHEAFPAWLALRQRILRDPLGLHYTEADVEAEREQQHLIVCIEGVLVGGLIWCRPDPCKAVAKVRQVAVDVPFQGRGIGRFLMEEVMRWSASVGVGRLILHARLSVVPFYESLGFEAEGDVFEEVGIPHRFMSFACDHLPNR